MNPQSLDTVPRHPLEKGWHTPVKSPYLFIDGCMQVWPDADFARMHECGNPAYLITTSRPHAPLESAIDSFVNWWQITRTYPNLRLALTPDDIVEAKAAGQSAIILGTQDGLFLGQELGRLELFWRMGLRVMIPAYNARTPLADGCLEPADAGLSRLGYAWVEECNRVGVLIDCTHVGQRSTLDIIAASQKPVVFTHSNPKALVDIRRNITDEQMKLCADKGGVIGQTNWAPLNLREGALRRPTLEEYIEAIKYVANLVGSDHVSIGTDMSQGTYPDGPATRARKMGGAYEEFEANHRSRLTYVEGFDDYSHVVDLAFALGKAGFSDREVENILGGNLLRVFRETWK